MLTPQEVSARSFTKMVMGGYNMTMVDEFLDELTDDYTSLYKENASLKAKLKVLVRATLLTAQRTADSLIKEAEGKRDEMLKQAETAAREKLEGFRKEAEESDRRLRRGQEELLRFIAESRALCVKQIEFMDKLPGLDLSAGKEPPPAAEAPEKPAEETPEIRQTVPPAAAQTVVPSAEELLETAEPAPAEDLTATRRVNINELKFGPNYRSEAD